MPSRECGQAARAHTALTTPSLHIGSQGPAPGADIAAEPPRYSPPSDSARLPPCSRSPFAVRRPARRRRAGRCVMAERPAAPGEVGTCGHPPSSSTRAASGATLATAGREVGNAACPWCGGWHVTPAASATGSARTTPGSPTAAPAPRRYAHRRSQHPPRPVPAPPSRWSCSACPWSATRPRSGRPGARPVRLPGGRAAGMGGRTDRGNSVLDASRGCTPPYPGR